MQTLQFTRALTTITTELKVQELVAFLRPYVLRIVPSVAVDDTQKDTFSTLFIASQVGYAHLREDARISKIMTSLGVPELYSPQRFGRMTRHLGALQQSGQSFNSPDLFVDFYTLYNGLSLLITFKDTCVGFLEADRIPPVPAGNEIVELRLLDYDHAGVENERVQQFFASLARLHEILSQFLNASDSRLKVAYVDSGSDLLVGFQCAKVLADIIKGLFAEFWEKVKFQPFDDFQKKIGALSAGLTFVSQVKGQVDNQTITEVDGRALTHRVMAEMTTLVGIGASLPQDEVVETVDNRKLLAEKRGIKLLGSGNDDSRTNG